MQIKETYKLYLIRFKKKYQLSCQQAQKFLKFPEFAYNIL